MFEANDIPQCMLCSREAKVRAFQEDGDGNTNWNDLCRSCYQEDDMIYDYVDEL